MSRKVLKSSRDGRPVGTLSPVVTCFLPPSKSNVYPTMRSFIALGTLALASTILAKPLTYNTKTDTTGKEPQGLAPELPSRHVTLAKRSPLDAQHLRSPSDFADTHELYRYGSDEIPSNVKVVELNNNGTASNKTLPQKSNPDLGYSAQFDSQNPPEPIRGSNGAPFLHESNTAIDYQNPDGLAAPPTDAGTVPNLKWSFSLSHTRTYLSTIRAFPYHALCSLHACLCRHRSPQGRMGARAGHHRPSTFKGRGCGRAQTGSRRIPRTSLAQDKRMVRLVFMYITTKVPHTL